eukprot:gene24269-32705_t
MVGRFLSSLVGAIGTASSIFFTGLWRWQLGRDGTELLSPAPSSLNWLPTIYIDTYTLCDIGIGGRPGRGLHWFDNEFGRLAAQRIAPQIFSSGCANEEQRSSGGDGDTTVD